jgi:hypothetical protein
VNTALEQDLRGEVALGILAYLAWADAHSDASKMLDGSIAAWLTAGKPDDPGIARALVKLRSQLAHYVDRGGHVPGWFPASLLKAIGEPCCARDLVPSAATRTDALPMRAPSENSPKQAVNGGHSAPNSSRNLNPTL